MEARSLPCLFEFAHRQPELLANGHRHRSLGRSPSLLYTSRNSSWRPGRIGGYSEAGELTQEGHSKSKD
jgi:hypothetical protein